MTGSDDIITFRNSTQGHFHDPPVDGYDDSIHHSNTTTEMYKFVAYVVWYAILLLCCIVPTLCSYRRRRFVEARLRQQQEDLQRWQRQHGHRTADGATSNALANFLLLDPVLRNSESGRQMRAEKITEQLEGTTMKIADGDFEENNQMDETDKQQASSMDEAESALYGTLEDETQFRRIQLPVSAPNGNRAVPGLCAICLCPYDAGDSLAWSARTECRHAFHADCIVPWLSKKETEVKCPVCRQDYCTPVMSEQTAQQEHADLFDSLSSALNYARSQAVRTWAVTTEEAALRLGQMSNVNAANSNSTRNVGVVEMTISDTMPHLVPPVTSIDDDDHDVEANAVTDDDDVVVVIAAEMQPTSGEETPGDVHEEEHAAVEEGDVIVEAGADLHTGDDPVVTVINPSSAETNDLEAGAAVVVDAVDPRSGNGDSNGDESGAE